MISTLVAFIRVKSSSTVAKDAEQTNISLVAIDACSAIQDANNHSMYQRDFNIILVYRY